MDVRKNLFSEGGGDAETQLPREVGESPSLAVFRTHGDVALRAVVMDMVGWVGVRLDDSRGLFQP